MKVRQIYKLIFITPARACTVRGYVIMHGMAIYLCGQKKNLNGTLAVESHYESLVEE